MKKKTLAGDGHYHAGSLLGCRTPHLPQLMTCRVPGETVRSIIKKKKEENEKKKRIQIQRPHILPSIRAGQVNSMEYIQKKRVQKRGIKRRSYLTEKNLFSIRSAEPLSRRLAVRRSSWKHSSVYDATHRNASK